MTLILGTAYLTLQAHQRTRAQQAETLRAQAYILNSLSYVPASAPKPKTIAEELALLEYQQELLAAAQQNRRHRYGDEDKGSFLRRAKDRWNTEVEGVVRWASTKDWTAAREDAEFAAANVWARATGGEPPAQLAARTRDVVSERASAAAGQAREGTVRASDVAWLKADEAKEAAGSIWERGFRKGKEAVGKAKAAVGIAEEKVADAVANGGGITSPQSEAERVIQQRYERKPDEVLSRTAEEVLADRYKPIGQ